MWGRCAAAGAASAASATSASARGRGRNVLVIGTPHGSSAGDTRGPRREVHRMVGCMTCARVTPVTRRETSSSFDELGSVRWEWPGAESNCRHADFQSAALPTELPGRTYAGEELSGLRDAVGVPNNRWAPG